MYVHTLRSAEELQQAAGQSYLPVIAEPRPGFRGRLALQTLSDAVSLSEARTTAVRTFQTVRMAATSGRDDLLLFCVHLAGSGRLHQHERVAELGPGVGVLYEGRSAWDLDVASDLHSLLLQFPRHLLPMRPAEITEGCARRVDPRSPGMRLLTGYIRQLAGDLDGEQRNDAGLAAIELLVMALRGAIPAVPGEQSAGEVLLGLMRSHVRDHLADPRLTVAELARRHHVSVRHAHALFGRIGVTPGAYIREQRLLRARTMLSDPKHDLRPVSDIGAAVGLGELRTFERAFQRQFGMTPARWRQEHRTLDTP
ncbi:helix-turn-helix domain-containing protein [Planotetraspora phitsanulokensis]|uniref:AraC family transcriptional regulator n=1 Tax=Planotetraspora phitsanulokensis TaxID=575192 RepID=A0A8J3XGL6_9ACTN|nr:helix-turn-helix domain-containing protein [Planotetraspora phitsanulokensis]GII35673.1 AraC family transcriptional regulator [Planotetraspora phitsanulokensis]